MTTVPINIVIIDTSLVTEMEKVRGLDGLAQFKIGWIAVLLFILPHIKKVNVRIRIGTPINGLVATSIAEGVPTMCSSNAIRWPEATVSELPIECAKHRGKWNAQCLFRGQKL